VARQDARTILAVRLETTTWPVAFGPYMHMNLTTTAAATEAAAAMCDVASWLHFHSLKSLAAGGNGITNFCN